MTERTEQEKILNEPEQVKVGYTVGKTVSIVEPPMRKVRGHFAKIGNAASLAAENQQDRLTELGRDFSKFNISDLMNMGVIADAFFEIIGEVVGENGDFAQDEMTLRQNVNVIKAYCTVVGVKEISEFFFGIADQFRGNSTNGTEPPLLDPSLAQSSNELGSGI